MKFTGLWRDDETGLDHTLYRQYSSTFGRWYSPDPMAGDILNPQSLNRYAYIMNNPVNSTGPTGLGEAHVWARHRGIDYANYLRQCLMNHCGFPDGRIVMGFEWIDAFRGAPGTYFGSGERGEIQWGWSSVSPFQYHFSGRLYGHYYDGPETTFDTWDEYADWRTGIAALPESRIYAAWELACQHSTVSCSSTMPVSVRLMGGTYNVTVPGSIANVGFPGTLPNPFTFEHGTPSYYTWSPINPGHVVPLPGGGVEAHHDAFNPWFLFPLHLGEWVAGKVTGNQYSTATCSSIGGCN